MRMNRSGYSIVPSLFAAAAPEKLRIIFAFEKKEKTNFALSSCTGIQSEIFKA